MSPTRVVHVVAPGGVADRRHPSGGNAYDAALVAALRDTGRLVALHPVTGAWPAPSAADLRGLRTALAALPDHALVIADGLVACAAPDVLDEACRRLRVVVLVHMAPELAAGPDPYAGVRRVLAGAAAVVATSSWTRERVLELGGLAPERVHVVAPGVAPAPPAVADPSGRRLLCVASVVPAKGHDVVLDALASLTDLDWDLACVGDVTRDPQHVAALRRRAGRPGLAGRVRFTGPLDGAQLDRAYATSDLHVLATRNEGYGMALTESLARGVPVVATSVGGVPEAVGHAGDGERPGLLVRPDDPDELAGALRGWLTSATLRAVLRARALDRRTALDGWDVAAARMVRVLESIAVRTVP